jgi:hypothetical protein
MEPLIIDKALESRTASQGEPFWKRAKRFVERWR